MGFVDMDAPSENIGNKKTKIFIVLAASISTTLVFVVPWFSNQMRYEEYSKDETISIRKSNEGVNIVSKYTIEARNDYSKSIDNAKTYWVMYDQEKEFRKNHEKKLEMNRCVNRYRNGNHPFALALTACKQELFYRESNKETTDENQ